MKIAAQPIMWEQQKNGDYEGEHGFYITAGEKFSAAWGEGDCYEFETLAEAQSWCQQQIDDYFAEYGMLVPELFDAPKVVS